MPAILSPFALALLGFPVLSKRAGEFDSYFDGSGRSRVGEVPRTGAERRRLAAGRGPGRAAPLFLGNVPSPSGGSVSTYHAPPADYRYPNESPAGYPRPEEAVSAPSGSWDWNRHLNAVSRKVRQRERELASSSSRRPSPEDLGSVAARIAARASRPNQPSADGGTGGQPVSPHSFHAGIGDYGAPPRAPEPSFAPLPGLAAGSASGSASGRLDRAPGARPLLLSPGAPSTARAPEPSPGSASGRLGRAPGARPLFLA
jgi:hypothetical protein